MLHSPTIPVDEYPQRWHKVQALLQAKDLDFLLAYADDRATFGPAHARWFANFPVHFEPVCILIPKKGEPVMLVGPESREYALLVGRIPDVRVLKEFTHPYEDYPYFKIQSLAEIIADIGLNSYGSQRGGLGGLGLIGVGLMTALQAALPAVEWVDIENDLCELRSQKTPSELDVIRHAYKIAETGFKAGVEAIHPGATERSIAAAIESAMRFAGAEGTGIDTIVASGPNTRPILARSTFRTIQSDDLVLLTVAPRYEGYHAAIGRLVMVGSPGAEVERALDVAIQAQEACANALRPGIEGRKVEAIGRRIAAEAGLEQYMLYSALHSLGVIEFEPPIFGPGSAEELKENMIISIDIPMFNTPWGGLRVENGYLITHNDAEPLQNIPFIIRK